MLSRAVDKLESKNVWVYLDAGHSDWVPANQMAQLLKKANIAKAHGFATNVSNYMPTGDETTYADQINNALGMTKPYVIDTSRNGNGSQNGQWCNPAGTQLGTTPRSNGAEMLLWVKAPGESDGACGTAPTTVAGQYLPRLAKDLISGG